MSKTPQNRLRKKCNRLKAWSHSHRLPSACVVFMFSSLLMIVFVISWCDSWDVIRDMWNGKPGAKWVQCELIKYSDIIVAVSASIIVALLSITITMYVFLKSALDRVVDENPYIASVSREYQDNTSDNLLWTTSCSVFPLLLVLGWYSVLRFQPIVSQWDYRWLILGIFFFLASFSGAIICTALFWSHCLGMRKRLSEVIQKKKEEYSQQIQDSLSDNHDIYFLVGYWIEWETTTVDNILKKSKGDIPNLRERNKTAYEELVNKGKDLCDTLTVDQYINLFSRIEYLLMSGVGGTENRSNQKYNESDIITVIQERSDISTPTIMVEKTDLQSREYRGTGPVLQYIDTFRAQIGFSQENETKSADSSEFFKTTRSLYVTLKDYRDLLISERYLNGNVPFANTKQHIKSKSEDCTDQDGEKAKDNMLDNIMGLGMYYFFLRVLGLFVSAVTIKNFTFNGNVLNFANFYNSTLINVSFYSTQFYHTIFARTKFINVTMDLSEIDNVFFYYTRLSNTSLSNTKFTRVDFENIQMRDCDLSICIFSNCGFQNSSLTNTVFNGSSFSDSQLCESSFSQSKLENITIENTIFTGCDFSGANLRNWQWEKEPGDICLKNCIFSSSTWDNMKIAKANLSNSVFDDANLSFVSFDTVDLTEALFRNCELPYASFTNCPNLCSSSFQDANLYGASFESCELHYSSFFRANASYTKFESCFIENGDCAEAYFRNAKLVSSSFVYARLYNATFNWAEITSCQFTSALSDHVQFTSAKCEGSCFQYTSMTDSSFSGSIFENCDFTGADLSDSAATDLLLKHCKLYQTDFSRIKFVDCVFHSTEPSVLCCVFTGSVFSRVRDGKFSHLVFENCSFDQTLFSDWVFDDVVFRNCSFRESIFSMCHFDRVSFEHCSTVLDGKKQILNSSLFVENHLKPIANVLPPSADISFDKQSIMQ